MTVPGIDMVVATGLMAAIGPVARFAGPDKLVAYLGLNPSVPQSGEGRPRHGRITEQGRTHARTMLVEAAWQAVRGPGPLRAFYHRVATRRGQHVAAVAVARKLASSSGTCSAAARTTPGCDRRSTPRRAARPGAAFRPAGAPRPAGHGLRVHPRPHPPRGETPRRAGRDGLPEADGRMEPAWAKGAHGGRNGGATVMAARPSSHLTPGSSPRGRPWASRR